MAREDNKIYEYVNDKILQLYNPNYNNRLLRMKITLINILYLKLIKQKNYWIWGGITQDEFDEIKRNVLYEQFQKF